MFHSITYICVLVQKDRLLTSPDRFLTVLEKSRRAVTVTDSLGGAAITVTNGSVISSSGSAQLQLFSGSSDRTLKHYLQPIFTQTTTWISYRHLSSSILVVESRRSFGTQSYRSISLPTAKSCGKINCRL